MHVSSEARASRLTLVWFVLFSLLALSLFRLQIVRGGYFRSLSEKNRLRLVNLEAPRGKIEDRNGKIIASSRLSFNCTAFLRERPSRIKKSFERLSAILGEDVEALERRYKKKKAGAYQSVVLAEDISLEQAVAIEEQLNLMPGLMIETRPLRTYPYAEATAHLTGYVGPQSQEESEEAEFHGYRPSDWVGRDGLEKSYESYLRGHSGGLQLEVDNKGQYLKVLGVKEPKEGLDLQLSIDADVQQFAYDQLQGKRGAVAVMDLASGGLLAMVNSPSYDSNLFSSSRGRKEVGKYFKDERSPMMNRAIQGQYPPGSIFKVITALAALESKKTVLNSTFSCPGFMIVGGKRFGCWKEGGHGTQNLYEAYAHSCDVFFYMTGRAAGPDAIHQKAVEFGYSLASGLDLPGERKGSVPSREWKKRRLHSAWYDGDTMNFSIGQGYLLVTPMQALGMAATMATKGLRIKPHLANKIDGMTVAERHSSPMEATPEYMAAVRKGLEEVVNSPTGTGRLAKIPGVRVAGKTGTAETHKDQTHAWFVGYAPADKPKVAFVVFLEFGGHGGLEAATLANALLLEIQKRGYL